MEVFKGLKTGASVLSEIQAEMSLEDVEKLMDETAEGIAYQNEISNMLAGKITEEDEEDILGELDAIVAEIEDQRIGELPSVPVMPAQKVTVSPVQEEEEPVEQEEERPRQMMAA